MNNICIFGGSFDPIHLGHLNLAERIREEFKIEKIFFVPTYKTPNKNVVTDAQTRSDMVSLAIEDNIFFKCCNWEIDSKEVSYTYNTLNRLIKMYKPENIFLIAGADTLCDIKLWYKWEKVISLCKFLVGTRENPKKLNLFLSENKFIKEKVLFTDIQRIDISSSLIRNKVKSGKSIKYLVKENVRKYILERQLYR